MRKRIKCQLINAAWHLVPLPDFRLWLPNIHLDRCAECQAGLVGNAEARQAEVEGVVILEVQTDKTGKIVRVKVLRSVPMLDEAAIEAVKQWVYEPLIIKGEPKGVIFTVTVSFKLTK